MSADPVRAAADAVAALGEVFAGPWRRGMRQMHTVWPAPLTDEDANALTDCHGAEDDDNTDAWEAGR